MGNGNSSVSPTLLEEKHVVIIGGGYGGIALASTLQKNQIPFTLVDPKDCFHHNVAACRAGVFPEQWNDKQCIDFKKSFGDHFHQGFVTKVDLEAKKIFIGDDQESPLEFTDVVFAVGSNGPFPGKSTKATMEDIKSEYETLAKAIEKSDEIVIIGGGPVGVEMAGEIVDRYKDKKIHLIHSGNHLVTKEFGDTFQTNMRWCLDNANVEVILNDRVVNLDELKSGIMETQTVKTQEGKNINCQLVLICIGMKPDLTLSKTVFGTDTFDQNNRLEVNEFLQVKGHTNVYAIGDCTNTKEFKMAAHAERQGELLGSNFLRSLKNQPLNPYKTAFEGMVITFGSCRGAGVFNGWNLPSFAVGFIKGKTLFTEKFWKMMGQEMPT